jgi:hypothetical protein
VQDIAFGLGDKGFFLVRWIWHRFRGLDPFLGGKKILMLGKRQGLPQGQRNHQPRIGLRCGTRQQGGKQAYRENSVMVHAALLLDGLIRDAPTFFRLRSRSATAKIDTDRPVFRPRVFFDDK